MPQTYTVSVDFDHCASAEERYANFEEQVRILLERHFHTHAQGLSIVKDVE